MASPNQIRQQMQRMLKQFKGKGIAAQSPTKLKQTRQKALATAFKQ